MNKNIFTSQLNKLQLELIWNFVFIIILIIVILIFNSKIDELEKLNKYYEQELIQAQKSLEYCSNYQRKNCK